MNKEPEMIQIDKENAKVLLSAIGEDYKCGSCGVKITENNFGIIHADVQVCNSILCQIWGIDKLEELKDAQDNKQNHSQESPNGSHAESNGVSNRKIHPDTNSQRKKDGEGSLPKITHLEIRSNSGEDNLRENMPEVVVNHADTNSHQEDSEKPVIKVATPKSEIGLDIPDGLNSNEEVTISLDGEPRIGMSEMGTKMGKYLEGEKDE